jgi:hypothetical protein
MPPETITPNCWAKCLGDCSEKISREHVISRALFLDHEVTVHGFPWCKTTPKKIGLPNLTAKILCRKHNSDLSDLDTVGAAAFDAIRDSMRLSQVRAKMKPRIWQIKRYRIDGPKLERWFLKTLINLSFEQAYRIGQDAAELGEPSKRLVEIAFGFRKFEEHVGLSTVVHVGQQMQSRETVTFAPLVLHAASITGGLFGFRGIRCFLSLDPPGFAQVPNGIGVPGEDWSRSQLNFHNTEMRALAGKYISHVIHWDW